MKKIVALLVAILMAASPALAATVTLPTVYNSAGSPQDSAGMVVANPVTAVSTAAAATSLVVKASPGNLLGFEVHSTVAGFAFVVNATTAPTAGGAAIAPLKCYAVAANTTISVAYNPPLALSAGGVIVFSSTGCFTNTASATAFISGDMQ